MIRQTAPRWIHQTCSRLGPASPPQRPIRVHYSPPACCKGLRPHPSGRSGRYHSSHLRHMLSTMGIHAKLDLSNLKRRRRQHRARCRGRAAGSSFGRSRSLSPCLLDATCATQRPSSPSPRGQPALTSPSSNRSRSKPCWNGSPSKDKPAACRWRQRLGGRRRHSDKDAAHLSHILSRDLSKHLGRSAPLASQLILIVWQRRIPHVAGLGPGGDHRRPAAGMKHKQRALRRFAA